MTTSKPKVKPKRKRPTPQHSMFHTYVDDDADGRDGTDQHSLAIDESMIPSEVDVMDNTIAFSRTASRASFGSRGSSQAGSDLSDNTFVH